MKHDMTQFRLSEEYGEEKLDDIYLGQCGGRCLCDGCSQDCSKEPGHGGEHRCSQHINGCSDI